MLVAWCVGRFARYSSSPGSLYSYVTMILPPWLAAIAGWSLLLAYVATGASVLGGFYHYANVMLLRDHGSRYFQRPARDHSHSRLHVDRVARRKISTRLMLWIEAVSVTLIVSVVLLVLARHGLHGDPEQLHLRGMTGGGLRSGAGARAFQLCRLRKRDDAGSGSTPAAKDNPPGRDLQSSLLGGAFSHYALTPRCSDFAWRPEPGDNRRAHARASETWAACMCWDY